MEFAWRMEGIIGDDASHPRGDEIPTKSCLVERRRIYRAIEVTIRSTKLENSHGRKVVGARAPPRSRARRRPPSLGWADFVASYASTASAVHSRRREGRWCFRIDCTSDDSWGSLHRWPPPQYSKPTDTTNPMARSLSLYALRRETEGREERAPRFRGRYTGPLLASWNNPRLTH